jgi:hypothetical protein
MYDEGLSATFPVPTSAGRLSHQPGYGDISQDCTESTLTPPKIASLPQSAKLRAR